MRSNVVSKREQFERRELRKETRRTERKKKEKKNACVADFT